MIGVIVVGVVVEVMRMAWFVERRVWCSGGRTVGLKRLIGSDVGGGGGGVVVGGWCLCWSKITIAKEKLLSEDHSPNKSHIFPLYNGIGLTAHELTEISHLGTSMM